MNLLLTGCFNYSEKQLEVLSTLGYTVHFMQNENESLPIDPTQIEAVVCNGLFLNHSIEKFTRLKFIQLTSAGLDRVQTDTIKARGILLYNAKGVYSTPMAEWALFRVLEYYKRGRNFNTQQACNQWIKNRNLREIAGTKVAVIGAGDVGQEVAKRFQAMGAFTHGFDIHTSETPGFICMELTESFIDKVNDFDIIILTAPLLPSTRGLINKRVLNGLKENAIIVNIARGGLIDESALINTLSKRKDVFAALDVFEEEPLNPNSPLWNMNNVAISPHNSFVGSGNNQRMFKVIFDNLKSFVNNK